MNITELKELADKALQGIDRAEAEMKSLAAQLEDAQGEIRALRATEAGLIERVKVLEEFASKVERQFWDATHPHSVESTLRDAARALLEKKE